MNILEFGTNHYVLVTKEVAINYSHYIGDRLFQENVRPTGKEFGQIPDQDQLMDIKYVPGGKIFYGQIIVLPGMMLEYNIESFRLHKNLRYLYSKIKNVGKIKICNETNTIIFEYSDEDYLNDHVKDFISYVMFTK